MCIRSIFSTVFMVPFIGPLTLNWDIFHIQATDWIGWFPLSFLENTSGLLRCVTIYTNVCDFLSSMSDIEYTYHVTQTSGKYMFLLNLFYFLLELMSIILYKETAPPPPKKKLCTNLTSLIVISLCIFSVEIYVCTSSKWQFFNHHTNCMYKCMHACILKLPAWSSHFGPEKRSIQAHQIVTSFEPQLPPFLQ